jgi:hypothetical protein
MDVGSGSDTCEIGEPIQGSPGDSDREGFGDRIIGDAETGFTAGSRGACDSAIFVSCKQAGTPCFCMSIYLLDMVVFCLRGGTLRHHVGSPKGF